MQKLLLINGELVAGEGETQPVYNPATGDVLLDIAEASAAQVDAAVQAADRFSERCISGEIQGAGAVVQDQDFRFLYQSSGDRKPLLLSAGEVLSVLFQHEIQFTGFAFYDFLGLSQG